MKKGRFFTIAKMFILLAIFTMFAMGAVLTAATAANAQTYIATIDSYNANLGMIQFTHNDPNVDKKTLFFAANDNTEMYSGEKPVKLSEVWKKTKKVRIQVDKGRIQRIDVLEWY